MHLGKPQLLKRHKQRQDTWSMHGWSETNEIRFLDYIVSDARRGLYKKTLTDEEKITRLEGWLKTWGDRKRATNVNHFKVEDYAKKLLEELK